MHRTVDVAAAVVRTALHRGALRVGALLVAVGLGVARVEVVHARGGGAGAVVAARRVDRALADAVGGPRVVVGT